MTEWQTERISCPFCKDPENGGVDVKLESCGTHSTDYPGTQQKISLCGGCTDTDFEIHLFCFHRCPRCNAKFIENFGNRGVDKAYNERVQKYLDAEKNNTGVSAE